MFPGMRNRSLKGGLQSQVLTASWWGQGRRQENNTLTLCSSCLHIFCRSLSWAKPERPDMMQSAWISLLSPKQGRKMWSMEGKLHQRGRRSQHSSACQLFGTTRGNHFSLLPQIPLAQMTITSGLDYSYSILTAHSAFFWVYSARSSQSIYLLKREAGKAPLLKSLQCYSALLCREVGPCVQFSPTEQELRLLRSGCTSPTGYSPLSAGWEGVEQSNLGSYVLKMGRTPVLPK